MSESPSENLGGDSQKSSITESGTPTGPGASDSPTKVNSALSKNSSGCLKPPQDGSGGRPRTDTKGNTIDGKKKHHASFIDQVHTGTHIAEVKEVRSYKQTGQSGCGCAVM